jgi:hypothetical protein
MSEFYATLAATPNVDASRVPSVGSQADSLYLRTCPPKGGRYKLSYDISTRHCVSLFLSAGRTCSL